MKIVWQIVDIHMLVIELNQNQVSNILKNEVISSQASLHELITL